MPATPPTTPIYVNGIKRGKSRIPAHVDYPVYLPGTDKVIVPEHESGYYGCLGNNGGACVSSTPRHVLWTEAVCEEMASDLSMPIAQIRRLVWAYGRACQKRLVMGRTCGIPFVGELRIVSYQRDARRIARLRRIAEARCQRMYGGKPGYKQRLAVALTSFDAEYRPGRNHMVVTLYQSESLFHFYRDHVNQSAAQENSDDWKRLRERYKSAGSKRELNPYRLMTKREYAYATGNQPTHPSGRKYRLQTHQAPGSAGGGS